MSKEFHYTLLTEQTAGHVAKIIEKVYADSFETLALPSAEQAWQAHAHKKELVALAFYCGQAVAMVTLKGTEDNSRVFELGMLSVVHAYRKSNVANELVHFAKGEFVKLVQFDAVIMENVSTHYFSQRKAAQNGAVDCAVAFSAMPELADNSKRLSYIFAFFEQPEAQPQPIYIPKRYADNLLFYYGQLKPRQIMPATYSLPAKQDSKIVLREFPTLKLIRLSILTIGCDFEQTVANALQCYGGYTVYVYLPLSSPYCSYAVDCLAGSGFFIAGILPFWFGADGLLMQRCLDNLAPIKIYGAKAKLLAKLAQEDRKKV